jgi:hypothetical protein
MPYIIQETWKEKAMKFKKLQEIFLINFKA